ncbi:class E sortase [Streptomyces sp. ODS28]|uniref:class E sortase n=1 Tax=Streptomyces sp. ODS28 TaxID=3136688 RepID=UPI0031EC61B5
MTSVRPEHEEGAHGSPYGASGDALGDDPYGPGAHGGAPGAEAEFAEARFRAAVDALADPLNDPLPGERASQGPQADRAQQQPQARPQRPQQPPQPQPQQHQPRPQQPTGPRQARDVSPWFRTRENPTPAAASAPAPEPPVTQAPAPAPPPAPTPAPAPPPTEPRTQPRTDSPTASWPAVAEPISGGGPAVRWGSGAPETASGEAAADDRRTVGLRRPGGPGEGGPDADGARSRTGSPGDAPESVGRAARRRAAKARTGWRGWAAKLQATAAGSGSGSRRAGPPATAAPPVAGTRLEARRAERARREGPGIIASRFIGETFITLGVLMLLFVAYQLWWTNVLAGQQAGGAASDLHDQWKDKKPAQVDPERRAGQFAPGEGFAIIHIPKLGIDTPIAQGVSKEQVLDHGLVGHYDQQPLKTAMPWDKQGNFALAGHRNTHGEPFRYINRLVAGDEIVVETASKFYTYRMTNRLASTSPSNTSVIDPVPRQSGFRKPGRYITLTTCTPEFTSKYRLIVWGNMVDERPRSQGKPDALVGGKTS